MAAVHATCEEVAVTIFNARRTFELDVVMYGHGPGLTWPELAEPIKELFRRQARALMASFIIKKRDE